MKTADLVVLNAKVITVDQDFSIKQAIAVQGNKIVAVGKNEKVSSYVGKETTVLDLKGKPILPGINDTHMHAASFGANRPPLSLDLSYPSIKSIGEMKEAVKAKVVELKPGEWVRGFGWDQVSLEECKSDPSRLPRKWDFDSVSPENPLVFMDFSGHTLLVNSKALELAGITKDTPSPESGEIEKAPVTGEPTGIFMELEAHTLITEHVPVMTKQEKRQALLTTLDHLKANGITSYTDAGIGPGGEKSLYGNKSAELINIYKELLEGNELTARVTVLLLFGEYGASSLEDIKKHIDVFKTPKDVDKERLRFPGIKIFADGIPMTKTSWMNEEYVTGGYGTSVIPGETMQAQRKHLIDMITYIHKKGYQVGIHATGDRASDAAIDGFVKAYETIPDRDLRHYVIHGDFISFEKAETLAKYNCGITMQPYISTMISDFEPAVVGEKRAAYEWPTRTVMDAGANLASSSDTPVTYPNWRKGVQAAVLREGLTSGKVSGPEQCITVAEAIRTYTINGAWQDHMENLKGSIEVGKLADFCVIGEDILNVDPHSIGDIPVLMTVVGGNIVYDATEDSF